MSLDWEGPVGTGGDGPYGLMHETRRKDVLTTGQRVQAIIMG